MDGLMDRLTSNKTPTILCYRYNALVHERVREMPPLVTPATQWTRSQQCPRHRYTETTNSVLTSHIKLNTSIRPCDSWWEVSHRRGGGLPPLPALCPHTHSAPTCFLCLQQQRKPLPVKRSLGNHFHPDTHCTQTERCYCNRDTLVREIKILSSQKVMCILNTLLPVFLPITHFFYHAPAVPSKQIYSCTVITQSRPQPEQ